MSIPKTVGAAALLLVVHGCAVDPTRPQPGQTVVDLDSTSGTEMVARRANETPASDLRTFQFTGPRQSLEVGLTRRDYRGIRRLCIATLTYDEFLPDQHYSLIQSTTGGRVGVQLVDRSGSIVAHVDEVPCL